jgi:alpha-L-fucosidase
LNFTKEGQWTVISVPCSSPEKLVSIIELSLKGDIKVNNAQSVDPEFGLDLSAKFSTPENGRVVHKDWMEKFGEWKYKYQVGDWKENTSVTWEFDIKTPGRYFIEVTASGTGPRVWNIKTDEGREIQNRQNTATIYHTQPIGWIAFDKAGKHTVTVRIPNGERENTSLAAIKITPL